MTDGESGLGEQAISKVAEVGITSQLDEVDELNVDVRADPLKVLQGEVDSIAIAGEGIVIQQDLRMDKLEIKTDSVSINPLSVVFGNVELTQPTNATAKISLTEADLNRALSSEFLRPKLTGLEMQTKERSITVDVQKAKLNLPGDGKFVVDAELFVRESKETQRFLAVVIPRLHEGEQRIALEIVSTEGQGLTPEISAAILDQITTLLDIRNFEIPGMSLQLERFDVQKGRIVLYSRTQITQIPSV